MAQILFREVQRLQIDASARTGVTLSDVKYEQDINDTQSTFKLQVPIAEADKLYVNMTVTEPGGSVVLDGETTYTIVAVTKASPYCTIQLSSAVVTPEPLVEGISLLLTAVAVPTYLEFPAAYASLNTVSFAKNQTTLSLANFTGAGGQMDDVIVGANVVGAYIADDTTIVSKTTDSIVLSKGTTGSAPGTDMITLFQIVSANVHTQQSLAARVTQALEDNMGAQGKPMICNFDGAKFALRFQGRDAENVHDFQVTMIDFQNPLFNDFRPVEGAASYGLVRALGWQHVTTQPDNNNWAVHNHDNSAGNAYYDLSAGAQSFPTLTYPTALQGADSISGTPISPAYTILPLYSDIQTIAGANIADVGAIVCAPTADMNLGFLFDINGHSLTSDTAGTLYSGASDVFLSAFLTEASNYDSNALGYSSGSVQGDRKIAGINFEANLSAALKSNWAQSSNPWLNPLSKNPDTSKSLQTLMTSVLETVLFQQDEMKGTERVILDGTKVKNWVNAADAGFNFGTYAFSDDQCADLLSLLVSVGSYRTITVGENDKLVVDMAPGQVITVGVVVAAEQSGSVGDSNKRYQDYMVNISLIQNRA